MADSDTRAGKGYIQLPVEEEIGGIRDKIRPHFFILKQRMIKILQTQGFSSPVFVFQRPLCLPVHPA